LDSYFYITLLASWSSGLNVVDDCLESSALVMTKHFWYRSLSSSHKAQMPSGNVALESSASNISSVKDSTTYRVPDTPRVGTGAAGMLGGGARAVLVP
jgi:hypothetical protein